jgi:sulfur carrier protein
MKIRVNGEEQSIQALNLDCALLELGFTNALVATALNGDFIPRSQRPQTVLSDGDTIEVLAPMEGG